MNVGWHVGPVILSKKSVIHFSTSRMPRKFWEMHVVQSRSAILHWNHHLHWTINSSFMMDQSFLIEYPAQVFTDHLPQVSAKCIHSFERLFKAAMDGIGIDWCFTISTGKAVPVSTSNKETLSSIGSASSISVSFGSRNIASDASY